ncbi:hypothetical protein GS579_16485 [Rhodococcus hoagii]|nr:hypothetical protein [Prescottella equi]
MSDDGDDRTDSTSETGAGADFVEPGKEFTRDNTATSPPGSPPTAGTAIP